MLNYLRRKLDWLRYVLDTWWSAREPQSARTSSVDHRPSHAPTADERAERAEAPTPKFTRTNGRHV